MICIRRACGKEIPDGAIYCPFCGKKQTRTAAPKTKKRPNGTGTVYQVGGSWRAEYRVFSDSAMVSRRTRGGFATRADAEICLQTLRSARVVPRAMRVVAAWEQLIASPRYQELSKDKQSHYRTAWGRLSAIAGCEIGAIPYPELQALVDAAPGDYYAKRDIKTLLGKLWNVAIKNGALAPGEDNTPELELPPIPTSERDAYTVDEVHEMWRAYQDGCLAGCYGLLMCYTGMRPGELMLLDPEQIDLGAQRALGGIKTAAGMNREIPLAAAIIPVMQDALAVSGSRLVKLQEADFYAQWRDMVDRYKIRAHMTPHSCRHSLASAFERAQVSPIVRKLILGHAIRDITDHYTHVDFAEKLAAVELATKSFAVAGNA